MARRLLVTLLLVAAATTANSSHVKTESGQQIMGSLRVKDGVDVLLSEKLATSLPFCGRKTPLSKTKKLRDKELAACGKLHVKRDRKGNRKKCADYYGEYEKDGTVYTRKCQQRGYLAKLFSSECTKGSASAACEVEAPLEVSAPSSVVSIGAVPATEEQKWLEAHNARRACHKGVGELMWDDEMAKSADAYIKDKGWKWRMDLPQGKSAHSAPKQRPNCGGTVGEDNCGENLAWHTDTLGSRISPTSSVRNWYLEVLRCKDLNSDLQNGCQSGSGATGHFTALIWKAATHLGCAISANGEAAVCRYRGGQGEGGERKFRPNLEIIGGRNYPKNVVGFAS